MSRRVSHHDMPHLDPVKRIELSEKNMKLRLIAVIILFVFGMTAIMYSVNAFFGANDGWTEIKADTSAKANCSSEFTVQFFLGAGEASSTAEYKALSMLYTQAAVDTYQAFHADELFDGVNNVAYLNQHPNEEVEVPSVLYQAFETLEKKQNRNIYLGPLYLTYQDLYQSKDDSEAINFDINKNAELAEYYAQAIAFAGDDSKIRIQLLGNNKVCLFVSEDYLAYAKENQEEHFIDFSWMKNAFIIDYFADVFQKNNFCFGSISSYDGFVRNLDTSDNKYVYNIFDCEQNTVYPAASMNYSNGISLVFLKNYELSQQDASNYYEYADGDVVSPYLSVSDGLSHASRENLICYSYDKSCAQVLMDMIPVYVQSEFQMDAIATLKSQGIYSVFGENNQIHYNDQNLEISDFFDKDGIVYQASLDE